MQTLIKSGYESPTKYGVISISTVLGIDESGRGPVIGPMIICGALFEEDKVIELKKIGVKDSKLLTPKQREQKAEKIRKIANKIITIEISAEKIDEYQAQKINLNKTECMKFAEIINMLKPDKVIIDSPQKPTNKFVSFFKNMINVKTELVLENYADRNYPEVSAASIIAKVTRDEAIKKIIKEYGLEIKNGYSHDREARKFLKEWMKTHKDYPPIVRKSWITARVIKDQKKQSKLDVFAK